MQKIRRIHRNQFLVPLAVWLFTVFFAVFPCTTVRADGVKIKGIDVSRWQGTIDWEQVKKDGVEFAMVGIGRYQKGVGTLDTQFTANMTNAIAQDIKVGVYLYSMATTVEEAEDEAEYVLDQIDGYKISYPVAFDIEDDVHRKLTTKQRTDITIAFLNVIEEAGYHPMIYASQNWFDTSMDLTRLTKYDKWVACWTTALTFKPTSMWQYSSTGKVKGITGAVDLDYSYKDYAALITPRTKAAYRRPRIGWKTDGTHYWYVQEDGSKAVNTFLTEGSRTYYVNGKGYRVTGWKKIGGKYYYFAKKTGVMKKGWLTVGGKTYYLSKKTGVRKTGWLTLGSNKYYLNKKGVLKKGWLTVNKKTYFMRTGTGKMYKGWLTQDGKTYYFSKKTGVMRKGWLTLKGKKYYFDSKGVRVHGWRKIGSYWYYFGPQEGVMQKNLTVDGYHLGANGRCTDR